MSLPQISIILPVYNAERFITDTIASIIDQTYKDFELIIIDDGSTDRSLSKIAQFEDDRIVLLKNEVNSGIVFTLNRGIKEAKGKYIARMDADDIANPSRLKTQFDFLEQNADVSVLGTFQQNFGQNEQYVRPYQTHELIKAALVFNNHICHPTVMMRTEVLESNHLEYKREFLHTEDWALWFDCTTKGIVCQNLPEVLLRYRVEGQNITAKNRTTEKERHLKIYEYILSHFFEKVDKGLLELHWAISRADVSSVKIDDIKPYFRRIQQKLISANYDRKAVKKIIAFKKTKVFYNIVDHSKSKSLQFLISNGLFSFKHIRYLLGATFSRS